MNTASEVWVWSAWRSEQRPWRGDRRLWTALRKLCWGSRHTALWGSGYTSGPPLIACCWWGPFIDVTPFLGLGLCGGCLLINRSAPGSVRISWLSQRFPSSPTTGASWSGLIGVEPSRPDFLPQTMTP